MFEKMPLKKIAVYIDEKNVSFINRQQRNFNLSGLIREFLHNLEAKENGK